MAEITLTGFDAYVRKIESLKADSTKICKATVFPGAGILADKVREELDALQTISDAEALGNWQAGQVQPHLSVTQKAGLQASLGVSPIRREPDGAVRASVGFPGYNDVKTRHFPQGQPNPEVARSLEKGSSYLQRDPFMSRAVRAARKEAETAMAEECDRQIARVMGETTGE